ncbi:MAG TPA: Crp/Fnr family transcriptional regulator [Polyangiaceae bacterium]|nr:Crp/Fnr family transcriptional regulator [Polyangiaceae bacterium]
MTVPHRDAGDAVTLRALAGSNLFVGVDPARSSALSRTAFRKTYERGAVIHHQGRRAAFLSVVASGFVKLERRTTDEPPTILGVFGPRETLGAAVALRSDPYLGTAIALTRDVQVVKFEAALLLSAARTDLSLAEAMQRALLGHVSILEHKVAVMSAGNVPQRLAVLLLSLAERFGDELEDGSLVVPLPLSRSEIASWIGARPETTIRALSGWQREGWMTSAAGEIRLLAPDVIRSIAAGSAARDAGAERARPARGVRGSIGP